MLLHKINLESEDKKTDAHYEHPLQSKVSALSNIFKENMMFSTENKNLSKKTISKKNLNHRKIKKIFTRILNQTPIFSAPSEKLKKNGATLDK